MTNILWRNIKWRFQNKVSILVTILQPMLWLVLYSTVASQTMQGLGSWNYTAYILPGIMVLVTFSACSSGGILNFIMKSNGSFYRILITPVSRSSIVIGQLLEAVLVSFFEVAVLVLVSFLLGVRFACGIGGIGLMLILLFLGAFFYSCIAYTISLHLPNEVIYETVMNAVVLPLFFLSSALFPMESLTGGLAVVVCLNPYTHIIDILRSLTLDGTAPMTYLLPVTILFLALCMAGYFLARKSLLKQTLH
ncbi:ABC transporter permease [Eubacteriales bacterium OttesenSCG-928-A19]|nr:ABC transporter permease [Eubacteriales bacterium OttesenSCG-928-A19]